MDLLALRGVGTATKERLALAGISSVEDLARARDLSVVAEWSGIPASRLAPLVEEAMRAKSSPRPPGEAFRGMVAAVSRFGRTLVAGVMPSRVERV